MASFPDIWRGEDATMTLTSKSGVATSFNAVMQNMKIGGGEEEPTIVHQMGEYDRNIEGRVKPLEVEYDVVITDEDYFKIAWGGSMWDEHLNVWSSNSAFSDKEDSTLTTAPGSWSGAALSTAEKGYIGDEDGTNHSIATTTGTNHAMILCKVRATTAEGSVTTLGIRIKGYCDATTDGYTVKIWDDTNSEWDAVGTNTASSSQVETFHITSSITNYIDSSGDIYVMIYSTDTHDNGTCTLYLDYVEVLVSDEVYPKAFYFGDTRELMQVNMSQTDGVADGTRLRHNFKNCRTVQLEAEQPAGDGFFKGTLKFTVSAFDKSGNHNCRCDTTDAATTRPLPTLEDY